MSSQFRFFFKPLGVDFKVFFLTIKNSEKVINYNVIVKNTI
jgi:hypothetical protein